LGQRCKVLLWQGIYTKEQVAVFVEKGKITAEEYEEIVGEPFPE